MVEYGIWSDLAGGLVDHQMSKKQAEERVQQLKDLDEDPDPKVVELCEQHEEQPKEGCEQCAEEWADDEDEHDED
jgi:hypothetical protein